MNYNARLMFQIRNGSTSYSPALTYPFDDQWHHVAGSYENGTAKIYFDGEFVTESNQVVLAEDLTRRFGIGACDTGSWGHFFNGLMAEVRLWNYARSEAEIQTTMNSRLTGNEPGLIGYWPINEGSGGITADKSSSGNTGTITQATWVEANDLPLLSANLVLIAPDGQTIIPSASEALTLLGTDFGPIVTTFTAEKTFVISNSGAVVVTLTNTPLVTFTGNSLDFSIVAQPATNRLSPGTSTAFTVRFAPQGLGLQETVIAIASDDPTLNNYTVAVQGQGVSGASLEVTGSAGAVISSGAAADPALGTDWGKRYTGEEPLDRTFTLSNTGIANLVVADVTITGSDAFTIVTAPDAVIGPGDSTTMTIRCAPSAAGNVTAEISFSHNAPQSSPFTFTVAASAGVAWRVAPTGDDDNDGRGWSTPFQTLQKGLQMAQAGDAVWVAAGTYTPGEDQADLFSVNANVALYGGFTNGMTALTQRDWKRHETILSGDIGTIGDKTDNSATIVSLAGGGILDGVVISNATAGLRVIAGTAEVRNALFVGNVQGLSMTNLCITTISNCTFRANETGLYNDGGKPAIFDSLILANTSRGIDSKGATSALTATDTVFVGNTGFGIYLFQRAGIFTRCIWSGNAGTYAIYVNAAPGTIIEDCVFSGNMGSSRAGAVSIYNIASLTLRRNLIAGNWASTYYGGGVQLDIAGATILSCTIANNYSKGSGGGIAFYDRDDNATARTLTLKNSILWGNRAATEVGNEIRFNRDGSQNKSLVMSYCDIRGGYNGANVATYITDETVVVTVGDGMLDAEPRFAPEVHGTWSHDGGYNPITGQSILTNASATWTPGEFCGHLVNPDDAQVLQYYIVTNTTDTITIWGNAAPLAKSGTAYTIYDYHLASASGRWRTGQWVRDNRSSVCIDAGDPATAWENEPKPNGKRVNLGAYGNTAQASMTPESGTLLLIR